ncbi:MAG: ABC transporter substrate-binding protein [Cyclobacteriaceae bacterium]|nr:ABC transporter substrate-binding protein [Cyclobacteriaceae bacterium]
MCLFQATAQDFKRQYRQAKDLFEEANYSAAMEAFKALTVYDQANPYPEYASYYYALSAEKLGYASVAKDMLLQIKKLYPTWDQLNEVNYWLCKIYFEQGQYFQGLLIASQITDPAFQSGINNLKRVYLAKIDDIETLKMILEEYPSEKEAARALVKLLGKQPIHLQETELINSLLIKFDLPREQLITIEVPKPILKETYRVALIMPFLAASLDPSPVKKRNQFVLDLYDGMKLAADTLSKMGIRLELLAYDNERNNNVTKKIVGYEELKTADLIVGPLFQEVSEPIQEFALANQISLSVNPISNNSDLIGKSPFAFLFQPSHETIGIRSAEWVARNVNRKTCMVYYGEGVKDSVMAFNFIKRALELGVNIVYAEEVRGETSVSILTTLASATEYDEWKNPTQFKLKKDSIGSIFVASDNELIYSKVINSVETRRDSIIVVGQESWLQETSVDYSKFERTHVTLSSPNYRSMTSQAYADFRRKYLQKHGTLPVEYASIGYEFVMTLGQILAKYGANFTQTMPPETFTPGTLSLGYQWQENRDNGKVPFITFNLGKLVVTD